MRQPDPKAYFIDPAQPRHPLNAKLAYAAKHRLVVITEAEANALSAALRAGNTPEAPGEAPAVPEPSPPPATAVATSGLPLEPQGPLPSLPPVPSGEFTISDLLSRADPPDKETGTPVRYMSNELDIERRAMAKSRVMAAVLKAAQTTTVDQMRYELALQAKNDNVRAMGLMEPEAGILRVSVAELAQRIVEDRRTRERRMMQVYAILARASTEIDAATGAEIDALADRGVQEIAGVEDA